MRQLVRIAALCASFVFLSIAPRHAAAQTVPGSVTPAPTATTSLQTAAKALLKAINKSRVKFHVPRLSLDRTQSVCSLHHSVHMAAVGYISHDQFPSDICVSYSYAGENVGMAPGSDPVHDVLVLQRMMMNEGPCPHAGCPNGEFETHGHYLNLTDKRYTHIGIGLIWKGSALWLTESFTG